MSEQVELIKLIAVRLGNAGIPYMITGSAALEFYTQPRMTRDIDLVVQLNASDGRKLHQAFSSDFHIEESSIQQAIQQGSMFNAIHLTWLMKVDFIVQKDSEYRKMEFERRRSMDLDGSKVFVVSPEDLILSKLEWSKSTGSEMQKRDIQSLLSAIPGLDYNYLNKWALALGVSQLLQELKS